MKYTTQKLNYSVENYLEEVTKKYSYPVWQREDCWSEIYKQELIVSILNGIDIPKIYIARIKDTDIKFIIDGGHRTRALQGFKNNEFWINYNGKITYYNMHFEKETRNKTILTREEKNYFDDFELSIIIYKDIEENECRNIFNKLQNARPMDIEDVINSHQSPLVDFIRDMINQHIWSKTIKEHFSEIRGLSEDKTKVMSQLVSWYSIIFPIPEAEEEIHISALKYIKKGNKNNSPLLDGYIKKHISEISEENKIQFIKWIEFIFNYLIEKEGKVAPTDMNTLIHSHKYISGFNICKFTSFIENVDNFKRLKKSAENFNKERDYNQSKNVNQQADKLNSKLNNKLEKWAKTRKDSGNGPGGMEARFNIVIEMCVS